MEYWKNFRDDRECDVTLCILILLGGCENKKLVEDVDRKRKEETHKILFWNASYKT